MYHKSLKIGVHYHWSDNTLPSPTANASANASESSLVDTFTGMGWVTFAATLIERILEQMLAKPISLVLVDNSRDSVAAWEECELFLCVLSKAYAHEQTFAPLLTHLDQRAAEVPVFKILKEPISDTDDPMALGAYPTYDLFYLDINNRSVQDLLLSIRRDHLHWTQLIDLVYDLYTALTDQGMYAPVEGNERPLTVFIAEATPDVEIYRNIIRRELHNYGYRILPEFVVPEHKGLAEAITRDALEEADLVVQMFGAQYGSLLRHGNQSIAALQHQIIHEHTADAPDLPRHIWITPNLEQAEEKQRFFLETLKHELKDIQKTELMQGSLEEFKVLIKAGIRTLQVAPQAPNLITQQAAMSVYLIHEQSDQELAQTYLEALRQQSAFEVIETIRTEDVFQNRQHHLQSLLDCDVVILMACQADKYWVEAKLLDLLKLPGLGRETPLRYKYCLSTGQEQAWQQKKQLVQGVEIRTHDESQPQGLVAEIVQLLPLVSVYSANDPLS
ncbi:hypothetical protein [Eisenibacter elegans]|uniref:hypothetical protein n=1 Tax=Eisenibacter elegans TaxID=997 RepID=UPI00041E2D11|nr:hypothetical protein [Eisenibacter elegans]